MIAFLSLLIATAEARDHNDNGVPDRLDRPHVCVVSASGHVGYGYPGGHVQLGVCPPVGQPRVVPPPYAPRGAVGGPAVVVVQAAPPSSNAETSMAVARYRAESEALESAEARATAAEAEAARAKSEAAAAQKAKAAADARAAAQAEAAKAAAAEAKATKDAFGQYIDQHPPVDPAATSAPAPTEETAPAEEPESDKDDGDWWWPF